MVVAAFPALAASYASDPRRTAALFERTLRVVLLLMFPVLLAIVMFSREALTLWVGANIAEQSTGVLQWLAVGVFINAMAQAPLVVLQSTGRPDLTAKLHLLELPLYLVALWFLAQRYGIVGVAIAWSARAAVDAVAMLVLAARRVPEVPRQIRLALWAVVVVPAVLGVAAQIPDVAMKSIGLLGVLTAFGFFGWTYFVLPAERTGLREWLRLPRRGVAPRG